MKDIKPGDIFIVDASKNVYIILEVNNLMAYVKNIIGKKPNAITNSPISLRIINDYWSYYGTITKLEKLIYNID